MEKNTNHSSGPLAPCFRSRSFIVTAAVGCKRYKLLQIMFRKTDGSLFVNFPYYKYSQGIVSLVLWSPTNVPPANLSLVPGGKVTSHLVKYAHHTDGRAHFSQDGKIYTTIKKQSVPLDEIQGHFFPTQLQGLASFEKLETNEYNVQPTNRRTVLNFSFGDNEPESIKIVGRLYQHSVLACNTIGGSGIRSVITVVSPEGKYYAAFCCSAPAGHPGDRRILVITCEGIPTLSKDAETALTFIGGFDNPSIVNDLSVPTTFLALIYPVNDSDDLVKKIGSIDFNR